MEKRFGLPRSLSKKIEEDEKKEDERASRRRDAPQDKPEAMKQQTVCTTPPRGDPKYMELRQVKGSRQRLMPRIPHEVKSPESTTVTTSTLSSVSQAERQGGYTALSDVLPCAFLTPPTTEGESRQESLPIPTRPQHHFAANSEEDFVYYRIVYRGVVACLSSPEPTAPRSGSYLSYGEIFASQYEKQVDTKTTVGPSLSPRRSGLHDDNSSLPLSDSKSTVDVTKKSPPIPLIPSLGSIDDGIAPAADSSSQNRVIRVDFVLTGGYSLDAPESAPEAETPKRSNVHYLPLGDASSKLKEQQQQEAVDVKDCVGYVFARRNDVVIVEHLKTTPKSEQGRYLYKIMSSTPLPILTGPSFDAPKTKAMVLPGTVHEVSLRVSVDPEGGGVWFLRLSHRRGWIADRKISCRKGKVSHSVPVVKEIFIGVNDSDDGTASVVSSIAVSSISSPDSLLRRRHRPPRRRRDPSKDAVDKSLPRQIGGKSLTATTTPTKLTKANDTLGSDKAATPSSNMSLLSDDESVEQNAAARHQPQPPSPDVSQATSAARSVESSANTSSVFYLMRVTAPRGLKILDAPQFQVNNLIHGKQLSGNVSSSHMVSQLESNMGPRKSHKSIFQTMSGRLTTTGPSKTGNPAIFDSGSKIRILPRGVLFESSRRMESTGAYSQGAGLIKLSDNSGWAVIPRQDELDHQYRTYQGGLAGVKEGEATRAFEEVGNAVLGDTSAVDTSHSERSSGVWMRVVARSGVHVSCPPPMVPIKTDDNDTSPTSSRGSSAVSGSNHGSNFGPLSGHDSDVASSVGSSFIDAMFRTPKKNKHAASKDPPPSKQHPGDNGSLPLTGIIPCGMIVQVEKWCDISDQPFGHEYARLCGGQGWIPLFASGKPVSLQVQRPDFRFGSFWFRVQSARGIKVRLGPSKKAPSIKSEDGIYFRFECGEFLRASEIMTVFAETDEPTECYAKLYRNRHVRLHEGHEEFRQLPSLTMQAELGSNLQ